VDLSIVIPAYNEEHTIKQLCHQIQNVLLELEESSEIIIVDDGSSDGTCSVLRKLKDEIKELKVVILRSNFGQTAALSAGFDNAHGNVIITMDADLQNDPNDIPKLIEKIHEGYDVVSGWRKNRRDNWITRKVPSFLANKLISFITGVRLHDYGCTIKAYRKEIVKDIELYGQMHRFIPALAKWVGGKITEIPVNHYPRKFGKSKYGIGRTIKVILDLITIKFLLSYATSPIQIFGFIGLFSGGIGFMWTSWLVFQRLFIGVPLGGRPALLFAVMLMFLGMQFVSLGLIAELLTRTYHESQKKAIYAVKEII
jgi:glycosyltransferase involved in cell wall biosynthesis